jgi:hypothetical protein
MIGTVRKGWFSTPQLLALLGQLPDNGPSDGRRRHRLWLRRLDLLNRRARPPRLRVGESQNQGRRPDDGAQHTSDGFRVHPNIPWLPWCSRIIMPVAAP